jgi:hypothetical protein
LMKRLTCRKKSSPPLLHPYSIDNPVFEDGFQTHVVSKTTCLTPTPAPVHVRFVIFVVFSHLNGNYVV